MGACVCGERWKSKTLSHCSACHRSFELVSECLKHRKDGHCLNPLDLGMVMKEGIWAHPMPESARLAKRAVK